MPASETNAAVRLSRTFLDLYPAEAAQILDKVPAAQTAALLEGESPVRAARVLERLSPAAAVECVSRLTPDVAAGILGAADVARVAVVLAALDEDERAAYLERLDTALTGEIRRLMTYTPGTAGSLMDRRVYSFAADLTVKQVLSQLHTLRRQRVQTLFVVDAEGRLVGALALHEVILASPRQRLEELLTGPPVAVRDTAGRDEIIEDLVDYPLATLPVVDFERRLIGAIRRDAMLKAVREQVTAGLQTMVGASREERALSTPLFAVRKRLGWLNVNLLTAFLAASVVGLFENTIATFTALAVLLPVVAGQSGNTGAQALAVTMRGLALREVRLRHWLKLLAKETAVGAVNGVAIALVTMLGVYIWSKSLGLCIVIGVAMVMSMAIASAAGTAIPMILTAVRQDPAQSSSIILTTVTDVVGFFSFLGLATLMSGML